VGSSTSKKRRKVDVRRTRIAAARAEAARAQRRRRWAIGVLGVLILTSSAVGIFYAVGATSKDDKVSTNGSTTSTSSTPSTTAATSGAAMPPAPKGRTLTGATPCPPTTGQVARVSQFAKAPPTCIDKAKTYTAEVDTTAGSFTATLDTKNAPVTANNFVVLARYGYFDGLPFHRIVPDFVIQGGSSGIPDYGTGGPGYDMPKVEKPKTPIKAGDLAMAKGPTAISGSQFFIVVGEDTPTLTSDFPRFGHLTSGLAEMQALAKQIGADTQEGAPSKVVTIKKVTITEK
jgi:cyclophilin family peptidyl-prolyl cis-trans isomerase